MFQKKSRRPDVYSTDLLGRHQGGVALVAYALESRASTRRAPVAPTSVELPHVGATRRADKLQALPAMMPPWAREGGGDEVIE